MVYMWQLMYLFIGQLVNVRNLLIYFSACIANHAQNIQNTVWQLLLVLSNYSVSILFLYYIIYTLVMLHIIAAFR